MDAFLSSVGQDRSGGVPTGERGCPRGIRASGASPNRRGTGRPARTRREESAYHDLDHVGEAVPFLGQAVEIVLPLAAWRDDPAVPQQGQVMADGRLALVQLLAERAHVLLAVG